MLAGHAIKKPNYVWLYPDACAVRCLRYYCNAGRLHLTWVDVSLNVRFDDLYSAVARVRIRVGGHGFPPGLTLECYNFQYGLSLV